MSKTKVLFLCTGNSARSQLGEALLRHHAGQYFDVYSAGFEPKGINPLTVAALNEIGVSSEGQYSKSVREYMGHINFGYLITVCHDADKNCPTTFPGVSNRLHWPFIDPAAVEGTNEEKLRAFREVRDQINLKLQSWLAEIAQQGILQEIETT